ncbi:hypothetical protein GGF43_000003 [Coemansia sp. RSA 2618]|nr:hypothetical protein GGF43_000003 [Coemansia sp. RSA 2618]
MHSQTYWLLAVFAALAVNTHGRTLELVTRDGNLTDSQVVSDPTSAWRAFSCMVPFATSDNTPFLMVYGGTTTTGETDPLKVADKGLNSLQVFNTKNSKWYAPNTANAPKTGPVLPGCGAASGSIWVYDPQYGVSDKASTSVSLLDSVHWSWSTPTQQGQLPVTRFGAAFAYVSSKQAFYMHGGIPLDDKTNKAASSASAANNLDILSPNDLKWSYASNGPARMYHTLCYMESIGSIVLFGGADGNVDSYNDVKVLSTTTNTWQYSPNIEGNAPAERLLHSAVCSNDTMYVFGGVHSIKDDPSDSTVWMLKANGSNKFTWSNAPISSSSQGSGPTARAGHSAAIYDGQMYVYGGIGSSGQDSTMYKLDLATWQWARTDIAGAGENAQKDSKNKTAVLIAAIISSVLGIVVVGITAAVIYRVIRRRNGGFFGGRRHSEAHSTLGSDDGQAVGAERKDSAGYAEAHAYNYNNPGASSSELELHAHHPADEVGTAGRLPLPRFSPASNGSTAIIMPSNGSSDAGPGEHGHSRLPSEVYANSGNESPMTPPASMTAGKALLSVNRDGTSNGRNMLDNVRARARSLSNKITNTRLSAAFSETSAVPTSSTVGRRRRTNATTSTANRRSAAAGRDVTTMYGPDYLRMQNEYRQAEAINEILLSGQPIPAWLRDAVNQVQPEDDGQSAANAEASASADAGGLPSAETARRFTIANNPDGKDAQKN